MKILTKKKWYIILGILIFGIIYALKNTSYLVRVVGFLFSTFMFALTDRFFALKFKPQHYIIFIFILTTGVLLSPLYFLYPNYDKILHLLNPILLGFIIFFLINKLKTNFSVKILLTFLIVVSILGLFEIGEFLLDRLFDVKAQGVYLRDTITANKLNIIMDKNDDTMIDLILGTLGILMFSLLKTLKYNYECYQKKIFPKKKKRKKAIKIKKK